MYNSNLPIDDLVIKNANNYTVGSGTIAHNYKVGSRIPMTFYANTSLISTNMGQYDKFKFPSKDSPLSEAGKLEIPKIESLEYIINLFVGKLDLDLKREWDELAGRDTSVPEISSNGM